MPYDIHARARQLVAQSRAPIDLDAAYRELSRRSAESRARRRVLATVPAPSAADLAHLNTIETPRGRDSWREIPQREIRLPYRDD